MRYSFDASFVYWTPLLSFILTWTVLFVLIRNWSHRILDHPNERSLHHTAVPRMGGIGVSVGLMASIPLVSPPEWWQLWVGALLLVGISLLDDLMSLPIVGRLVVHFLAAGGFASSVLLPGTSYGWVVVLTVAIVWMINLYNFMDGMDGLAGGMAVFGFGFLAIAAWLSGHIPLALVNATIAGAAAAFLLFNFHPAQLFLGDAGSTTFGYLAAGISLIGWHDGVWSLWLPVLVFSSFIVDATVTLLKRVVLGERFWQAHRSHYYQRLVLSGWGQRRTILAEYLLMAVCGIAALIYQWLSDFNRSIVLVACAALFLLLLTGVDKIRIPSKELA